MIQVNPYLTFNGNTREAMNFYKDCLGGELNLMTFGDAPESMPGADKNQIMHAALRGDGFSLMASDNAGQKIVNGTSITLSVNCHSTEDAERIFNNLAKGGQVIMPIDKTFWAERFGMLTDKYGMQWMVNYELPRG